MVRTVQQLHASVQTSVAHNTNVQGRWGIERAESATSARGCRWPTCMEAPARGRRSRWRPSGGAVPEHQAQPARAHWVQLAYRPHWLDGQIAGSAGDPGHVLLLPRAVQVWSLAHHVQAAAPSVVHAVQADPGASGAEYAAIRAVRA